MEPNNAPDNIAAPLEDRSAVQSAPNKQYGPAGIAVSPNDSQQPSSVLQATGSPALAEDAELIEKEWVEAVKRIVTEYKNDPYNQTKAMIALREDYLQKRYGKSIKVSNN